MVIFDTLVLNVFSHFPGTTTRATEKCDIKTPSQCENVICTVEISNFICTVQISFSVLLFVWRVELAFLAYAFTLMTPFA